MNPLYSGKGSDLFDRIRYIVHVWDFLYSLQCLSLCNILYSKQVKYIDLGTKM